MDETYDYRVKFKDIRVRPPNEDVSRARAQETQVCDHKGCDLEGSCKAPKQGGSPSDFHWFCPRHAAEYNRSWNFFDGMTEAEAAAFMASSAYGHQKTWRFGTGPMGGKKAAFAHDPRMWNGMSAFGPDGAFGQAPRPEPQKRGRTRLQVRALNELDLPEEAAAKDIRERYSDYVKRFHPDANGGDRSSEHKLARVIRAYKTLKAAGLTTD